MREESERLSKMAREHESLKRENASLTSEITDLQARSMRDNLLFFGLDEAGTPDERRAENCAEKILSFCSDMLNIPDAQSTIKVERAHRIGTYQNGKRRPIVVKFNHYPDKLTVKQRAREVFPNPGPNNPTESRYRVGDQFPKAIQERRKQLIPILVKAKNDKKRAFLSYDKLCIEGTMYTVDTVSRAGYNS